MTLLSLSVILFGQLAAATPAFDITSLSGEFESTRCVDDTGHETPVEYMTTITITTPDAHTVRMENHKFDASVPTENFERLDQGTSEGPVDPSGICIGVESATMKRKAMTLPNGVSSKNSVTLRMGLKSYTQTVRATLTLTADGVQLRRELESRHSIFQKTKNTVTCDFRRK